MKINVVMTKDKTDHKSFLIMVPRHTVRTETKILEQMEKYTEVPWKINTDKTSFNFLAVETGDITDFFLENHRGDEKAYVNWRMKWKNQTIEIATGK